MRRPSPVLLLASLLLPALHAGCGQAYEQLPGAPDSGTTSSGGGSDAGHEGASPGEAGSDAPGPSDASGDAADAAVPTDAALPTDASGDAGPEASPGDAASEASAAQPQVWVLRVGAAGAASAPSGNATAAFIDRFAIADGTTGGTIALPTAASGSQQPLTLSGSAMSEGALTLSSDGKSVVLAGYAAAPGAGDLHADGAVTGIPDTPTSGTNAVLRVIGTVNAAGVVSTSFTTTAYSGTNVRGAATTDGSAFWMIGDGSGTTGGLSYQATSGTAPTFLSTGAATVRAGGIFAGRLYGTTASGAVRGVFSMGAALPTVTDTATVLPGFPTTSGPSSYGLAGLALGATTALDTLYVCDDRSSASGGGVQRWKLSGGTWALSTTFNDSMTSGCRGVAVSVSGTTVDILVSTTETTGNHLLKLVDTTAGLSTTTATKLADAPANTVFRGVALAPN